MARIPNRFLFVWTGRSFPYYCRLAVESALLADADAEVVLAIFGDSPAGAPHFEAAAGYERVRVATVDLERCFAGLPAPADRYLKLLAEIPPQAHSARSNLVRYGLLHELGGIYLDFDVLVLRDFRHLLAQAAFIGEEWVWRVDEARVEGRIAPWMAAPTLAYLWTYGLRWLDARVLGGRGLTEPLARPFDRSWSTPNLNNAVIGSEPGGAFVRRVLAAALEASPTIRYHLGPTLVSRVWRESSSDVVRLPPEVFFVEPPSYSFRFFHGRPRRLPDEAILIHYVSSNHGALLRKLTPETLVEGDRRALFYALARGIAERARGLQRRDAGPKAGAARG